MDIIHLAARIIVIPALFGLPGYVIFYALEGGKGDREELNVIDACFSWVFLSFLLTSLCALALAELGRFSLLLLLFVVDVPILAFALLRWRRLFPPPFRPKWDHWQTAVLVLLLLSGGLFFLRPFENILGGRDDGAYVNAGIAIARRGSLHIRDEFFARLPQEAQDQFIWIPAPVLDPDYRSRHPGFYWFKYPGFTWVAKEGKMISHGLPLYPACIAVSYTLFGMQGTMIATPMIALLSSLGLYLLGKALLGDTAGFIALSLLLANASQLWFARYANADILFQLLFIGGALYWMRFLSGHRADGVISGLCFGGTLLTKLDALPLFVPLAATLGLLALYQWSKWYWPFVISFGAMIVWAFITACFFAWPTYLFLALRPPLKEISVGLLGGLVFAILVMNRNQPKVRQVLDWPRLHRQRISSILGMAILGIGLALGLIVLASQVLITPPHTYPDQAWNWIIDPVIRLSWYLTPLGMLLTLVGAVLLVQRRLGWRTLPLILSGLVYLAINFSPFSMLAMDHIWAIRRSVSVAMPSCALFMAFAIWTISERWPRPQLQRVSLILLTIGIVAPLAWTNRLIISHREFRGAFQQLQDFAEVLPSRALVIFDGSWVGNYLAPALQFLYDKETVVFWPEPGEEAFDPETLLVVADQGLAEAREVFFVSTHDRPRLNAMHDLVLVRSAALVVPQLEHSVGRFPQAVERWELPYRIYQIRKGLGHSAYEAESLPHQVGGVVEDREASWGEALHAGRADTGGFLCYGPYDILPAGEYRALFRLKVGEGGARGAVVAAIDVAADTGQTVLARQEIRTEDFDIPGRYQEFELEFTNPKTQALEFRVYFTDVAELWVDNIEVIPLRN